MNLGGYLLLLRRDMLQKVENRIFSSMKSQNFDKNDRDKVKFMLLKS